MTPMIYDEPRWLLVPVFLLNDVSWNLPYSLHSWIFDHEKLIRNLKKTLENALIWNSKWRFTTILIINDYKDNAKLNIRT